MNFILSKIPSIQELRIVGQPQMTCFALASNSPEVDIMAVADVMEKNGGWTLERQQLPPSLHFSVMPHHVDAVDQLVDSFRKSVDAVKVEFIKRYAVNFVPFNVLLCLLNFFFT
jgi:sphinganine-1-phosphate aldolase